jgi:small subunit ribosomal protein S16
MAVKIRLTRMGKKRQPSYRVVVMDSRKPRDGEYIEQIGFYDPRQNPSLVDIDNEKAVTWLRNGAQPTERAQKLLEISGAWTQFKVAKGQIHTVPDRPTPAAIPVEKPAETTATVEEVAPSDEVAVPADELAVPADELAVPAAVAGDEEATEVAAADEEVESP